MKGCYKFLFKSYAHELDSAALYGGMGFGQELLVHRGEKIQRSSNLRPYESSKNQYRALCSLNQKLCVVDSKVFISLRDFIDALLELGVSDAIYTDMGNGWNWSWYRDESGAFRYIHARQTPYSTNWIVFYE